MQTTLNSEHTISSTKKGPELEKRNPGNMDNYLKKGDGYWECKECGSQILGARVAHSIWINSLAGGNGECKYETVPYCPNCDKEPNFHGAPIIT